MKRKQGWVSAWDEIKSRQKLVPSATPSSNVCYYTVQKIKFFIKDFFSKCDQNRRKLGKRKKQEIWEFCAEATSELKWKTFYNDINGNSDRIIYL